MALKDIINTIKSDTKKAIKEIESEKKAELKAISVDTEKEMIAKQKDLLKETKEKADRQYDQAVFRLQNQVKNAILTEKKGVINQAYADTLSGLKSLSDSSREELLKRFLDRLPSEEGEIKPCETDRTVISKLLEENNTPLSLSSENANGVGGFVFTSPSLDVDMRFETLLQNHKDSNSMEISHILFS